MAATWRRLMRIKSETRKSAVKNPPSAVVDWQRHLTISH